MTRGHLTLAIAGLTVFAIGGAIYSGGRIAAAVRGTELAPLGYFVELKSPPLLQQQSVLSPLSTVDSLGDALNVSKSGQGRATNEAISTLQTRLDSAEQTLEIAVDAGRDSLASQQEVVIGKIQTILSGSSNVKVVSDTTKHFSLVINGFTLSVTSLTAAQRSQIEQLHEVKRIVPIQQVEAFLSATVPMIGANEVWARNATNEVCNGDSTCITGRGIRIGILDSGVDYTHPDLSTRVVTSLDYNYVDGTNDAMDDNGHGTYVAGIIAGPVFLNLTHGGEEFFKAFAEMGVVLLLFVVGLSLNFTYLKRVGAVVIMAGIGQFVATSGLGFLLIHYVLGFPVASALYLSIAITFSSTIIVVKLLSDKNDLETVYGRYTIGLLLVQDIIAIVIMLFMTTFLKENTSLTASLGDMVSKGFALAAIIYFLSRLVLPVFLKRVAETSDFLFIFIELKNSFQRITQGIIG